MIKPSISLSYSYKQVLWMPHPAVPEGLPHDEIVTGHDLEHEEITTFSIEKLGLLQCPMVFFFAAVFRQNWPVS